jgi:hypothetical protein
VHYLDATITLTPADNGLTITAYNGEKVGGRVLLTSAVSLCSTHD